MKKSDKLFKDEFVHFRWDDSLEGKTGFMEDGIGLLEIKVATGVMDTIHKADSIGYPFKNDNDASWRFAYYDPYYEYKKAWIEGKKVQYLSTIYVKNKWEDVPDEWYWDGDNDTQYCIAPEKVLKPFKDIQELKKVWDIKLTGRTDIAHDYKLTEPMIWVRWKGGNERRLINAYNYGGGAELRICGDWISLKQLFKHYEFIDGSPCGVLVSVTEEKE